MEVFLLFKVYLHSKPKHGLRKLQLRLDTFHGIFQIICEFSRQDNLLLKHFRLGLGHVNLIFFSLVYAGWLGSGCYLNILVGFLISLVDIQMYFNCFTLLLHYDKRQLLKCHKLVVCSLYVFYFTEN